MVPLRRELPPAADTKGLQWDRALAASTVHLHKVAPLADGDKPPVDQAPSMDPLHWDHPADKGRHPPDRVASTVPQLQAVGSNGLQEEQADRAPAASMVHLHRAAHRADKYPADLAASTDHLHKAPPADKGKRQADRALNTAHHLQVDTKGLQEQAHKDPAVSMAHLHRVDHQVVDSNDLQHRVVHWEEQADKDPALNTALPRSRVDTSDLHKAALQAGKALAASMVHLLRVVHPLAASRAPLVALPDTTLRQEVRLRADPSLPAVQAVLLVVPRPVLEVLLLVADSVDQVVELGRSTRLASREVSQDLLRASEVKVVLLEVVLLLVLQLPSSSRPTRTMEMALTHSGEKKSRREANTLSFKGFIFHFYDIHPPWFNFP